MHYVLERVDEPGRPPFINALLHEQFHENGATLPMEYGWNFSIPPAQPGKLPPHLFMIAKDKKYDFDFASSFNGYIVSGDFLDAMKKVGIENWEISRLTTVNQQGIEISRKQLFFIRLPRYYWVREIVDKERSVFEERRNGEIKKISTLVLADKIFPDIFISTEISLTSVVFFSEKFIDIIKDSPWCGLKITPCIHAGIIKPA